MTDNTQNAVADEAREVPLQDRLRAIPSDTRIGVPLDWTLGTSWHAVGRDAHLAAAEIDRLSAENAALRKALEYAIRDDGGVAYSDSEDEIGFRVCCSVTSYKEHSGDCWVTIARAALNGQAMTTLDDLRRYPELLERSRQAVLD
jgi:hypothetical protein